MRCLISTLYPGLPLLRPCESSPKILKFDPQHLIHIIYVHKIYLYNLLSAIPFVSLPISCLVGTSTHLGTIVIHVHFKLLLNGLRLMLQLRQPPLLDIRGSAILVLHLGGGCKALLRGQAYREVFTIETIRRQDLRRGYLARVLHLALLLLLDMAEPPLELVVAERLALARVVGLAVGALVGGLVGDVSVRLGHLGVVT